MNDKVQMILIDQIRILNPRHRDPKKFETIVQSIKNLGLKKPIQISRRFDTEDEGPGYDLVCGQGRIEAFIALGYKEIPAIVVEISKEDRLLRSLVENMARRSPSPMELLNEIERLKKRGYNNLEISRKLDVDNVTIGSIINLKKSGEERLLEAALKGIIPLNIAIEISKADGAEMQRALLKAYEGNKVTLVSIRVIKRLIDRRKFFGKQRGSAGVGQRKTQTSADSLVSAYRRESQKQKLMVKKANVCEGRLLFVVTAFNRLLANDHFVTLLRAETLATMPKPVWEKVMTQRKKTL